MNRPRLLRRLRRFSASGREFALESGKGRGNLFIMRSFGGWMALSVLLWGNLQAEPKPNIVVIMADDLGWFDTRFQGNKELETPFLDRFVKQGMLFPHGYAAARSRAHPGALMTGIASPFDLLIMLRDIRTTWSLMEGSWRELGNDLSATGGDNSG